MRCAAPSPACPSPCGLPSCPEQGTATGATVLLPRGGWLTTANLWLTRQGTAQCHQLLPPRPSMGQGLQPPPEPGQAGAHRDGEGASASPGAGPLCPRQGSGEPGTPSAGHRHPVPPRRGRWVQPGVKSPGGGTGFPFPLPPLLQGAAGARGPSQTPPGTPRAGSGLPDTGTPLPLRPGALHPPGPPALCPPVASGPPPRTSQPCAPRWHRVPPGSPGPPGAAGTLPRHRTAPVPGDPGAPSLAAARWSRTLSSPPRGSPGS